MAWCLVVWNGGDGAEGDGVEEEGVIHLLVNPTNEDLLHKYPLAPKMSVDRNETYDMMGWFTWEGIGHIIYVVYRIHDIG